MRALRTFSAHKRDVTAVTFHPVQHDLFTSGSYEGVIMHWSIDSDAPLAVINEAHDGSVHALAWHPVGHVLCSASHDQSCRFWTRNRCARASCHTRMH
jgi:polyadenylation factor subunit 2